MSKQEKTAEHEIKAQYDEALDLVVAGARKLTEAGVEPHHAATTAFAILEQVRHNCSKA